MYAHNLKNEFHDLDIIAREDAWESAKQLGTPHPSLLKHGLEIDMDDGKIQVFNKWISDNWDVNELIDDAEVIEGIRFVRLDKVLSSKLELSRTKDIKDIETLRIYFKNL